MANGSNAAGTPDTHMLMVGAGGASRTSVEAVRATDGLVAWAYESHEALSDVLCMADQVIVATRSEREPHMPGRITALRPSDGVEQWRAESERFRRELARARLASGAFRLVSDLSVRGALQAMEGVQLAGHLTLAGEGDLIAAANHSVVFALTAATGALCWVTPPTRGPSRRLLSVLGGRIYVSGARGGVQALDARTGDPWWTSARPAEALSMAGDAWRVYVHGYDPDPAHHVIATLRAVDGTLNSRLPLNAGPQHPTDAEQLLTLTHDGIAYLLTGRRLRAVRVDDGLELWRSDQLDDLPWDDKEAPYGLVRAAVSEGQIAYTYMAGDTQQKVRRLHVGLLDARTGTVQWHWCGPEHEVSSPYERHADAVVAFGNVYVNTTDGIVALSGNDGRLMWSVPAGFVVVRMAAIVRDQGAE